ncbi:hypothetical protein CVD25_06450 [Bacillus canaveralius]|uniref:Uncharacterized protein n=1 Tax=Bacillus canaveralius TaxID=1403243 RepID=A0A2N5GG20_9BACI|nr:hypothetical protein [Bacillus canaveralius]PLR79708.1 hypothetical protein CU635_21695 [Bacillus canaveralius]PLR99160.1 hypothetical protein CVD25_06450 [Bacillus canaveralius]
MENLKTLSHELEYKLNSILDEVQTLEDVEVLLGHLVEDMENAVAQGEERAYYREHQRMVRVLWNLIRHTNNDLKRNSEKAERINREVLNTIMQDTKA